MFFAEEFLAPFTERPQISAAVGCTAGAKCRATGKSGCDAWSRVDDVKPSPTRPKSFAATLCGSDRPGAEQAELKTAMISTSMPRTRY
jgi:hypothetical protein